MDQKKFEYFIPITDDMYFGRESLLRYLNIVSFCELAIFLSVPLNAIFVPRLVKLYP